MNHHHIDRRRNPRTTDWEKHLGRSQTEPEEIERLVRRAREELDVMVFTRRDRDEMEPYVRAVVEGAHKRIGNNGGRR